MNWWATDGQIGSKQDKNSWMEWKKEVGAKKKYLFFWLLFEGLFAEHACSVFEKCFFD